MADLIIVDIDGCLTVPHWGFRGYYPENDAENRHILSTLKPVPAIVELVKLLPRMGLVAYMTGRPARFLPETKHYLDKQGVPSGSIYCRGDNDLRSDSVIKEEYLDLLLSQGHKIILVIEDRVSVVAMWRSRGIVCLQPAPGNY